MAKHSRIFERRGGFTLIEIMVAIGIFTVVMLIGVGALLSVNDANRKARALRIVMDNINFAVEDIVRKARIGGEYFCTDSANDIAKYAVGDSRDCAGAGGNKLIFKFQKNRAGVDERVLYYLQTDGRRQWIESQTLTRSGEKFQIVSPGDLTPSAGIRPAFITSPEEIFIEQLRFYVTGVNDSNKQPKITVVVSGRVNLQSEKLNTEFNIQTTISQRKTENG